MQSLNCVFRLLFVSSKKVLSSLFHFPPLEGPTYRVSVTSVSPGTGANHVEFLYLLEYCTTTAVLREKI